ncbi:acyltransferase [Granulicoccus sp. GXG6511]|uniref:acyltransferase n=1 Tax=Granulicoccus sp. GXG6511 TaxID=3381351 RepID=UPI003D7DA1C1
MPAESTVHASADVDPRAIIGAGTTVWHLAQVRENATIGPGCIIGRGAYIDEGVALGANCKIQNHALVYAPARLADGVFIGPAACLTNDPHPRAIHVDGERIGAGEWAQVGVTIGKGAAVGARAVVLGGVTVGPWALIAAGAVVTRDVPAHALVAGVPARHIGWVDHSGKRLTEIGQGRWRAANGTTFVETEDGLAEADGRPVEAARAQEESR